MARLRSLAPGSLQVAGPEVAVAPQFCGPTAPGGVGLLAQIQVCQPRGLLGPREGTPTEGGHLPGPPHQCSHSPKALASSWRGESFLLAPARFLAYSRCSHTTVCPRLLDMGVCLLCSGLSLCRKRPCWTCVSVF